MICSVFAGLAFNGDASRISELPRGPCGKFPGRVFHGRINVVDPKNLIDRAGLDGFGRHSENHGRCFVLGQHHAARRLDCLGSLSSIVAHARKHAANASGIAALREDVQDPY